jgi:hypothetical protein
MRILLLLAVLSSAALAQDQNDTPPVEAVPRIPKPRFTIWVTEQGSYKISGVAFSPEQIVAIVKALKVQNREVSLDVRTSQWTSPEHLIVFDKLIEKAGFPSDQTSVTFDETQAEQGGTGQPATRPESKSEDNQKPQ